jgi:hypothetical protein
VWNNDPLQILMSANKMQVFVEHHFIVPTQLDPTYVLLVLLLTHFLETLVLVNNISLFIILSVSQYHPENDPCVTNNGGCDYHTVCTNSNGSSLCGACPEGYSGNGYTGCIGMFSFITLLK